MDHKKLREKALVNEKLIMASLELTEVCNLSCLHCYIPKKKSTLSIDKAKKIIDKLHRMGVIYLTLTGGEIFSYKHFIEVYLYAKSKGFIISLMTNGTLLNSRIKKALSKYKPFDVSISIYGLNPNDYIMFTGKNGYKNLVDGLNYLYSESIPFNLKTVLVKSNYSSAINGLYEDLAKNYGKTMTYDPIIFGRKDGDTTSINERLSVNEITKFEESFIDSKEFWENAVSERTSEESIKCGGGLSSLSIDSTGYISICSLNVKNKFDFLTNSDEKVINFLKNSHAEMQNRFNNSPCYKCKSKSICRWCSAYAYLENNSHINAIPFFCELTDARIKTFA
ncbi:radical SAM protein [Vibrio fluvialis]|nr:radical SAM protein [Vibrio fluvialis]